MVMYHPNDNDPQSRPKNEPTPAIVVGVSKKTLPVSKDEKGNVEKTKEVKALNLLVLQDNPVQPFLHRASVVEKSEAESESLNYKLPYYTVEKQKANASAE